MHRACIGRASGTHEVMTLSVKLGEGDCGARLFDHVPNNIYEIELTITIAMKTLWLVTPKNYTLDCGSIGPET